MKEMKKQKNIYCCQRCGTVEIFSEKSINNKRHCPFCDFIMRYYHQYNGMEGFERECQIDKQCKTWKDVVRKNYAKPRHRDDELYKKREMAEEKSYKRSYNKHKKQNNEFMKLKNNFSVSTPTKPTVECPYCHSTNTKKISTFGRVFSTEFLGLGSSKVGKQWHCNNCNSDF